jgi:hypothetical protein
MSHQGALLTDLPFDHQPNVNIIKQDKLFVALTVGLDRLILVNCARQAEGQEAGEGERLSGTRFVIGDQLPSDSHVYFQQAEHTMGRPGQIEGVYPYATPRRKIDDMVG